MLFFKFKKSQIDTENDKNPKIFHFSKFLRIFCSLFKDFANWNVLRRQEGKGSLSRSLWWRDNCNVLSESVSNWHRKWQNSQNFHFSKILCIFSKFLTDFVHWNAGKGQQRSNVLFSRHSRRVYCIFFSEIVSNWHGNWQKTQNFQFSKFLCFFLLKFDRLHG